ncbi:MAG: ABC transporter ATP-binding protein [Gammaproteobacteria bacterium]|nr:ABC transporter ATP-binding protein [Gammaproteobacteria bacterium]
MNKVVLSLRGISKKFGDLQANSDINLDLHQGEVLALLGENGAGKSTLMSILFGLYKPDSGFIKVNGKELMTGNPKMSLGAGIGMVHQHFTLADNLTVMDNILLGTESMWSLRSLRAQARAKILHIAQWLGMSINPDDKIINLSVGEKQRVEIVKALYRGASILILDEPTAVLTPQESAGLFQVLKKMTAEGLSIVFISHKLSEVFMVADSIAVLRKGKLVKQAPTHDWDKEKLAHSMLGHRVESLQKPKISRADSECICTFRNVSSQQFDKLNGVNLDVRAGEILGIAGVAGNGQVALAHILNGTLKADTGEVQFKGQPYPDSPRRVVELEIARVPQDRKNTGVVADLTIWENCILEWVHTQRFSVAQFIKKKIALRFAHQLIQAFQVSIAHIGQPSGQLSGGNIQKLILGRELTRQSLTAVSPLIVMHQPTWGLDIGAVAEIHQRLIASTQAGSAVILISEDLDEVLALSDRIGVLHSGRLSPCKSDWTMTEMGLAMMGLPDVH